MNPIKKEKKKIPIQRRISKKQKAIARSKARKHPQLTLKERRQKGKLSKQASIRVQNIKARQHVIKSIPYPKVTLMDMWKEMMNSQWTASINFLYREMERRNRRARSAAIAAFKASLRKPIKEPRPKKKLKPYVPSTKALAHHKYMLEQKEENQAKRAEWVKRQKAKKELKRQKRAQSPNRLVCIRKEDILLRTRVSDAVNLVDKEGWKFIPKQDWKTARAEGKLTLLWEVERINLEKPTRKFMKPEKVTGRYKKAERIKNGKKLDAMEKEIRARRKRKGLKPYKPIKSRTKVVVTDKYSYAVIDKLEKVSYEFSKQGYKEALQKYKSHLGIIKAVKDSLIGTCVINENVEKINEYLRGTKHEKVQK